MIETVSPTLLHERFPFPDPGDAANKDQRGCVLVVGGSREAPGGVHLAGLAAMRAGAGRVVIATVESVTVPMAVAFPEARVIALPESDDGHIADVTDGLIEAATAADALVVGSGAVEPMAAIVDALVVELADDATVILDAAAIPRAGDSSAALDTRARETIAMPNPGEMATWLGWSSDAVADDTLGALEAAIARLGGVVALRDTTTYAGGPDGGRYTDAAGGPGLGTAGSGDMLAGVLGGLAASGLDPLGATLWAVHIHGVAGARLAARFGTPLGYLARELVDEIPATVSQLTQR